jgi:hypothetical protein
VNVAPGCCKTTPDISIVSALLTNERSEALKFATLLEEPKVNAENAIEVGMLNVNWLDPKNVPWTMDPGGPPPESKDKIIELSRKSILKAAQSSPGSLDR